ncbi:hypothetical protein AMTRI_Chr10g233440 [Amborella trichopoda]
MVPMPIVNAFQSNCILRNTTQKPNASTPQIPFTPQENSSNFHQKIPTLPDPNTYNSLLRSCSSEKSIHQGKQIHARVITSGASTNTQLETTLVTMYAKCGYLEDAYQLFDRVHQPNLVALSTLVGAFAKFGMFEEALNLYCDALEMSLQPDEFVYPSVLKACSGLDELRIGTQIHSSIMKSGINEYSMFVNSALVDMYSKCGRIELAERVFNTMHERDGTSWNSMISGLAQHGREGEALNLVREMELYGPKPDCISWNLLITVFGQTNQIDEAIGLFREAQKSGFDRNVILWNSVISVCAKAGRYSEVFGFMGEMIGSDVWPNTVTWNSIISGFVQNEMYPQAEKAFSKMLRTGFEPNSVTITCMLQAFADANELGFARQLHGHIIKMEPVQDTQVWNSLLDVYAKCGQIEEAVLLFKKISSGSRNPVPWNSMLSGYFLHGCFDAAIEMFEEMKVSGVEPTVITWNTLISGCVRNGFLGKSIELLLKMQVARIRPDASSLSSILPAIANMASLRLAKQIHGYAIRSNCFSLKVVSNSLLDTYTKCGSLKDGIHVFNGIYEPDLVSFTAMIAGYAAHGDCKEALDLFSLMKELDIRPTSMTFTAILCACVHVGDLKSSEEIFNSMLPEYGICPAIQHYSCMVDLLGRAGKLERAWKFIKEMPIEPDGEMWGSLLTACFVHQNLMLAKRVADRLLALDPNHTGCLLLLSNIHAANGEWENVVRVRKNLRSSGIRKEPGCCWIEVEDKVHVFASRD